ncbi:hypothetical protein [Modestobacter sp. DSM 44400]|uniref:hypothetical protein n=1 Tax=Modestobacter sp. DSM 44400 TaxID=1550230 RepID=UPI0020C8E805|nr:hypothetical protein [Modestobacter sp. DSM 44400]
MALIALLGFGAVVLLAMLLLHGYVWWRLVRGTTLPGRLRRRLTLLTVVLALLPTLAVGLRGQLPLAAGAPLAWVGYSWLGLAFYLFLTTLLTEPIRLIARVAERRSRAAEAGPSGARRVPRRDDEAAPLDGGRHLVAVRSARIAMSQPPPAASSSPAPSPSAPARWRWGRQAPVRCSPTPHPSSGASRSTCRTCQRSSPGCASSPSPTGTCRPPTEAGGSSGWSRR